MMRIADVHEIIGSLNRSGVKTWVAGGWGVDALLGTQTRPHDDLDLVLSDADRDRVLACLTSFHHDISAAPGMPIRFVLIDDIGRAVDIHPVIFDENGNGWNITDQTNLRYSSEYLAGHGNIGGMNVHCLTVQAQVDHHSGYVNHGPDEFDYLDMRQLADKFLITLPEEYEQAPGWQHPRRKRLDDKALI